MLERTSIHQGASTDRRRDGRSGASAEDEVGEPTAAGPKRLGVLVLTRHLDQTIVIADQVEVQVVGLRADTVRLRITAPRSIPVHRREVYEAIRSAPRPTAPETSAAPGRWPSRRGQGGLVLTRHLHQSVMIGDDVEVEVADVRSNAVRLRVTAPRDVPVHRLEIQEAIRRGESGRPDLGGVSGP